MPRLLSLRRSFALFLVVALSAPAAPVEFTRGAADRLIAQLPAEDPWLKRPDGSTLAWGESHLLHAFVDLYEATGDASYLAEAARRGDRLLAHRDDRRGATDGSGHSRPAWSMADKYVVAEGILVDPAGQPALQLRSIRPSHNHLTRIEVVPEPGGRFTLRLANEHFRRTEEFAGLSLDPRDRRFVATAVNAPLTGRSTRPGHHTKFSALVFVTAPPGAHAPAAGQIGLRPIPLAFGGYLGVIYHPLLRLAELVRARPELASLQPAAARFVQAAEESYSDLAARLWRDGPGPGEGFYLTCARGESYPYDNVGLPLNYLGRHTATELALHRLTGRAEYRVRAEKMAQLFHRRLRHNARHDLYTWNYWYEPLSAGWKPEQSPSDHTPFMAPHRAVEDVSHGALDVALAVAATEAGVVFARRDLERMARTLLRHVLTPARDGVRRRVDGTGEPYAPFLPALAGWLELAAADPAVYREIRRTLETTRTAELATIAAVLKWERKLSGTP
jgi:hypothetical protein